MSFRRRKNEESLLVKEHISSSSSTAASTFKFKLETRRKKTFIQLPVKRHCLHISFRSEFIFEGNAREVASGWRRWKCLAISGKDMQTEKRHLFYRGNHSWLLSSSYLECKYFRKRFFLCRYFIVVIDKKHVSIENHWKTLLLPLALRLTHVLRVEKREKSFNWKSRILNNDVV